MNTDNRRKKIKKKKVKEKEKWSLLLHPLMVEAAINPNCWDPK